MLHVALIMDGNRRWAQRQGTSLFEAYATGASRLHEIVEAAIELRIATVTAFLLSRENLARPQAELSDIARAINGASVQFGSYLRSRNVRLSLLGDAHLVRGDVREHLTALASTTVEATGLHLRLALAYSGRHDIVSAARSIAQSVADEHLSERDITEDTIAARLSTAPAPEPEVLIRTGGCSRLSDFLLYDLAYTDIVIEDALWPEFSDDRFRQIVRAWRAQHTEPNESHDRDGA